MTVLPDSWRVLSRGLAALALALSLAACGPGTGGTGTGPVSGSIGFSSASASSGAPSSPGDGAPSSICMGNCAPVTLLLAGADVELRAGCLRFSHLGGWSVGADGRATLEGELTVTAGAEVTVSRGTLRLDFAGAPQDSPQVTATLSDAAGVAVLGPHVLLRQAAGDLKPAGCP